MVHEAAATISTDTICLKPMPRAEVEVLWLISKNMDGSVDGNARLPVFPQAWIFVTIAFHRPGFLVIQAHKQGFFTTDVYKQGSFVAASV